MAADEARPGDGPGEATRDLRATIGGRYRIDLDAPLGAGGMCLVYPGIDLRSRKPVAAKTLRVEYRQDPESRARFRSEARLLAFLNHDNVVRVLAVVEDPVAPWVVLEQVPGRNVQDLLRRRGTLTPEEVVPILDQTAMALSHLHARGLVHLDVKPQNLVLTDDGRLKVIDFGLAQPAGQPAATVGGRAFGTVGYVAPEQAAGDPVGPPADIYALGCVAYELLTGEPPFAALAAGNPNAAVRARFERLPDPPSRVRPDLGLPRWVDDVVLHALAVDPAARYGDAVMFAALFRSWVEGDVADLPDYGPGRFAPVRPSEREAARAALRARPRERAVGTGLAAEPPTTARELPEATVVPINDPFAPAEPEDGVRRLARRLWVACGVLLLANLLVAGALLATQGRLPGIREPLPPAPADRLAGATAARDGAAVLSEPSVGAPTRASLSAGAPLTLGDAPLETSEGRWWPVTVSTTGGPVSGWMPDADIRHGP